MKNPYLKTTGGEVAGIEVTNIDHQVFEEGRREGIRQMVEWLVQHNLSASGLTIENRSWQALMRGKLRWF